MPASDIAGRIAAWMADRANNALFPGADLPAFDTPLVGFANGADPLFARIKEDIGADFYWTPREAFALAFAGDVPPAGELTVIAWILPQTAATRAAHKACRDLLRDNGGAVRYGFQREGDELGIYTIPDENVICLWPDLKEEVGAGDAPESETGIEA